MICFHLAFKSLLHTYHLARRPWSSEILSFLHLCFGQKHVLFLHEGYSITSRSKHHIFSTLHKESFIIFIFCLAFSHKSIQISEKESDEVIASAGEIISLRCEKGREDNRKEGTVGLHSPLFLEVTWIPMGFHC